jgi:hypothetical protein
VDVNFAVRINSNCDICSIQIMRLLLLICLCIEFGRISDATSAGTFTPIPISVDEHTRTLQNLVPPDYEKLSFDAAILPPDDQGGHYVDANNALLVQIFKAPGIKSLRIGGRTVDEIAAFPRNHPIFPASAPPRAYLTPPPAEPGNLLLKC